MSAGQLRGGQNESISFKKKLVGTHTLNFN